MNFDNWKSRSHYLGLLMTTPEGKSYADKLAETKALLRDKTIEFCSLENTSTKSAMKLDSDIFNLTKKVEYLKTVQYIPNLPQTAKSKLSEIYTQETTGRKKVVSSDYLDKGLFVEEDSITMFSVFSNGKFYQKNTVRKENDFLNGECDIDSEDEDFVADTKSSWDIFTFDKNCINGMSDINEWQLDAYMWLFNRKNAKLVFTCIDTPEFLIQKQERKLMFEMFGSFTYYEQAKQSDLFLYKEACKQIRQNSIYSDLPIERKIKIFNKKRDDTRIDMIKTRIPECRKFLNNLINIKNEQEEEIQAA